MKRKTVSASYLDSAVALLVQHFGSDRVKDALQKATEDITELSTEIPNRSPTKKSQPGTPNILNTLELLRKKDEKHYQLLHDFYSDIKGLKILPESQDIRQYANQIGLKEIFGKSRKDMIPKLMKFLCELPVGQLQIEIEKAANISEHERQKGYSILTDKLLGEK